MSEPPPPPYLTRTFVCRCGKTFEPPPEEAEALAALERAFGLDAVTAEAVCEECARAGHG